MTYGHVLKCQLCNQCMTYLEEVTHSMYLADVNDLSQCMHVTQETVSIPQIQPNAHMHIYHVNQ